MCGIAGILCTDGSLADPILLRAMTERLRHRGPDGDGQHTDRGAGIGHRRLAIIDLEGGLQPLSNEDGSIWVTFNGEIYNYRELQCELEGLGHCFRTHSDTEVLVHAYEQWGDRCVEHLRGMFAFAVWDGHASRLFLARDRVGIKPLYYITRPGLFAFASELQAFEALPDYQPTLDLAALDLYLHFQYIPAPFSVWREVRKLPPGHQMSVTADGRVAGPHRYWRLEFRPNLRPSEAEWLERLDDALRETIQTHLVSDVPFGAFLSGGVDSSTVVAYMAGLLGQPVHTFSIGFDEPAFDESEHARQVARQLGTRHHEERVRPDAFEVLPTLVRHYGEPFADSSALPTYYVSRLAARHVKMVLSGDGGDENFAGYSSYASLVWHHRRPHGLWRQARHAVGGVLRGLGMRHALPSPDDTWYDAVAYFAPAQRQQLWLPEHRPLTGGSQDWFRDQLRHAPSADLCSRFQHFDIHNYLPHDILCKVDIASMAHGLEVRVPLLDHKFMEFVATIPSSLKLKWAAGAPPTNGDGHSSPDRMVGKYLLKKNGERFFPPAFLNRRKQGFGVPIQAWFAKELRRETEDRLVGSGTPLADLFDLRCVHNLLTEHVAGRDHGWRLWALLFLAEWLQQSRGRSWSVGASPL